MVSKLPEKAIGKGPVTIFLNWAAPLIPYVAISCGLLYFHNAWAAMIGYHLGILLIIRLVRPGIPFINLFKSRGYRIPLAMAFMGAAGGILLYVLWPLLDVPEGINSILQNIGLNRDTWPWFIAYFIAVNPFLEELYWRGYLGGPSQKLLINDLLFAGYHLIVLAGKIGIVWLAVIMLLLTASAWFWRQADRRAQGLLPSIISHFTADSSVILVIYFMIVR